MARSKRIAAFAGAALTALALACNGIVGLDDYRNVECTGGRCDAGSDGPSIDGGPDALVVGDATGTLPVSWAKFKMPNYDGGGSDANLVSYTVAGGEVKDNVSDLVWRQESEQGLVKYEQAKRMCPEGWRLPSRIELVTLLDLNRSPRIDPVFAGTQGSSYWTTSEVRPYGAQLKRWTVNFESGEVRATDETLTAGVRCIKGAR